MPTSLQHQEVSPPPQGGTDFWPPHLQRLLAYGLPALREMTGSWVPGEAGVICEEAQGDGDVVVGWHGRPQLLQICGLRDSHHRILARSAPANYFWVVVISATQQVGITVSPVPLATNAPTWTNPPCPSCRWPLPQYAGRAPREGDALVCLACGEGLFVTDPAAIRLLTRADKAAMKPIVLTAIEETQAQVRRRVVILHGEQADKARAG